MISIVFVTLLVSNSKFKCITIMLTGIQYCNFVRIQYKRDYLAFDDAEIYNKLYMNIADLG